MSDYSLCRLRYEEGGRKNVPNVPKKIHQKYKSNSVDWMDTSMMQ